MSSTISIPINKVTGNNSKSIQDILAIEEPLEIRLSYVKDFQRIENNLSITMRTPGNDEDLALGFLFTEGIIENFGQVNSLNTISENVVIIELKENVNFEMKKLERHFYTSSSCGVCGKSSIEAISTIMNSPKKNDAIKFKASDIYSFPEKLRHQQNVFEQTGGLHASAIFNNDGEIILLREDVGRHNALDKLIGAALQKNMLTLNKCLLLLSGRASFELIQKAAMADIPIVAAVGAPSSLAVELAKEREMTLIGFLKNDRLNIYTGEQRVIL